MPPTSTSTATAAAQYNHTAAAYGANLYGPSSTSKNVSGPNGYGSSSTTYMNAPAAPSAAVAPAPPPPPASIGYLNSLTQIPESDSHLPLKSLLRSADSYRVKGQDQERANAIESAFVSYGIAAKYALERVPSHAEYGEKLTREQRQALERNGERILERLSTLKDTLLARQEEYRRRYGEPQFEQPRTSRASESTQPQYPPRDAIPQSARESVASSSYATPSRKAMKESVMANARAAAAGSSHTVVYQPQEEERRRSQQEEDGRRQEDDKRRIQQEEFRRREEEILETKRRAKMQESYPTPAQQPAQPPPPSQSYSQPYQQPQPQPPQTQQYATPQAYPSTSPNRVHPQTTGQQQPSPISPQYPGGVSPQYTGGVSPQYTDVSSASGSSSASRPAVTSSAAPSFPIPASTSGPNLAQIPPQYQLPPMPAAASYPPVQSRLQPTSYVSESVPIPMPIPENSQRPFVPPKPAAYRNEQPAYRTEPSAYRTEPPSAYRGEPSSYTRASDMANVAVYRGEAAPYTRASDVANRPAEMANQFAQLAMQEQQRLQPPTQPPSQSSSTASTPQPHLMPLESPTKYYEGEPADLETAGRRERRGQPGDGLQRPADQSRYSPPITTTSPPPPDLPGTLMNQHQKDQGYHPSRNSMFCRPRKAELYEPLPYDAQMLVPPPSRHGHGMFHRSRHSSSSSNTSAYTSSSGNSAYSASSAYTSPAEMTDWMDEANQSKTERGVPLKTVYLPRASLHRFVAIAKANTMVNKETCGLLLGKMQPRKSHGHKRKEDVFMVSTLLIPKQHATSDTCTMDEEESVMRFTEERGLITLGWIHTHPTQTCFMSSVDLHTHAGFQTMLPESFAVVCAPRQKPNYGIFRLTDPSGLGTILGCQARSAFHPHPEGPIYTDADRGHVTLKDEMSLEIVDLR